MNGTAVNWMLGAALAAVACVAGRRIVSSRPRPPAAGRAQSALHLAMALGMAAMLIPVHGPMTGTALRIGFGVLAVGLGLDRIRLLLNAPGANTHRLHHAAMSGIMALMAMPDTTGPGMAASGVAASGMAMPGMTGVAVAMPHAATGSSPVLLAAFGYAFVFALVFAWRLPRLAHTCDRRGAADPLGHACEITMLVSTAVMLLPLL